MNWEKCSENLKVATKVMIRIKVPTAMIKTQSKRDLLRYVILSLIMSLENTIKGTEGYFD